MVIRLRNIILCLVNKHFPSSNIGRKRVEAEFVLDELLRVLWTGCPWRSLRSTQSSYQTIHRHFMVWTQKNVFREAYSIAYKLQNRPTRRNLRFQCIDASFVKNIYGRDCVGRNPTDRGRKATKLSAIVDQDGLPLSLVFFPANVHDVHTVEPTLNHRIVVPCPSQPLYADKGYDSKKVTFIFTFAEKKNLSKNSIFFRVFFFFSDEQVERKTQTLSRHIESVQIWIQACCIRWTRGGKEKTLERTRTFSSI
jgi:transposase